MAYLISRIVVLNGNGLRSMTTLKDEMLLYAGSALTFNMLICVNSLICVAGYGHGLKPLLSGEVSDGQQSYKFHSLPDQSAHELLVSRRFDLD